MHPGYSYPSSGFAREQGSAAPTPMEHHEKSRLRAAAFRAQKLYPGPVGALVSKELLSWEEFGYRLGSSALVMQLVDHLLKEPLPDP